MGCLSDARGGDAQGSDRRGHTEDDVRARALAEEVDQCHLGDGDLAQRGGSQPSRARPAGYRAELTQSEERG
ncbi:hypothetical protein CVT30_33010 [Streptomyces sp. AMCC400023]|nr:hypothetical protein CVT30_33010 [Streptomyces sp. AMCC400023]